uniref:Uncharacterized protein n=1 Tax=Populus trichocarpa x Populus deltoides TaxID=3695 RepID=A9PJQ4_9ROSI|nr:unknown [Populus trichocarpa x Populus deltoides]
MMLRQISTERIILVTVLKLLLVDGRKGRIYIGMPGIKNLGVQMKMP